MYNSVDLPFYVPYTSITAERFTFVLFIQPIVLTNGSGWYKEKLHTSRLLLTSNSYFMSVQRMINSKFWSDSFVVDKLNPLDRYLFLYFLTNEKTNICGVYELPLRTISYETGIDKEEIIRMLARLKGKVEYKDGWVCLTNFIKHQNTKSKDVQAGIDKLLDNLPEEILSWSTRCRDGGGMVPRQPEVSNLIKPNLIKPNLIEPKVRVFKNKEEGYSVEFENFWTIYPEKIGKGKAYDSWKKLSTDEQEKSVVQIKLQIESNHFRNKSGIDYIPHPTTWLNQKRWEDEIKEIKKLDVIKFDKYGNLIK